MLGLLNTEDFVIFTTREFANRRFARLPELDLVNSEYRKREFKRLLKQLPIPLRVLSAMESKWGAI